MTEQNNVEIIDLTREEQKEDVQEVGMIFTQIVNELVGLRQDLKPISAKITKKYVDEIDDLYETIHNMKKQMDEYKSSNDNYYNLYEREKEKNKILEEKYEHLIEKINVHFLNHSK